MLLAVALSGKGVSCALVRASCAVCFHVFACGMGCGVETHTASADCNGASEAYFERDSKMKPSALADVLVSAGGCGDLWVGVPLLFAGSQTFYDVATLSTAVWQMDASALDSWDMLCAYLAGMLYSAVVRCLPLDQRSAPLLCGRWRGRSSSSSSWLWLWLWVCVVVVAVVVLDDSCCR